MKTAPPTTTGPSAEALKAAELLKAEYHIGNWSRFCDDRPDWDYADDKDIAIIIDSSFAELRRERDEAVAACQKALDHIRKPRYGDDSIYDDIGDVTDALEKATTPDAGRGK